MASKEALVDQVLARAPGGSFSEADMTLLAQLFPASVVAIALEAAFSKGVLCISTSSGRSALEFCFSGTRCMVALSPRLYCSCDRFCEALSEGREVLCKHILAAKIAVAAKLTVAEKSSSAEFADRCLQPFRFAQP